MLTHVHTEGFCVLRSLTQPVGEIKGVSPVMDPLPALVGFPDSRGATLSPACSARTDHLHFSHLAELCPNEGWEKLREKPTDPGSTTGRLQELVRVDPDSE